MISRFAVAKEKVLDDLENIVADLYQARARDRRRNLWNVGNPWRKGSKPEQMCVWLTGARRGAFKDYAGLDSDKGDAIDLVAFGLEGAVNPDSRMRAVAWVEDRYGIARLSAGERERIQANAASKRAAMAARDEKRSDAARDKARKFFFSCQAELRGTAAETYLASRGLELGAIAHLTRSLRFHPAAEHWMSAPVDADGNRTGKGLFFPALVSAMVNSEGRLCANHLTFLAPDGSGKAPVEKAKLMWPETRGLVIRISNGESGLAAEAAAAACVAGLCGVTEGVEDALSAALCNERLRMWAAGSLSGLLSVPDHACVSGFLIFKDNDWGKRQAAETFRRAMARISGFGKPAQMVCVPADWGKDINDAINA